jgi:hypothetical protein
MDRRLLKGAPHSLETSMNRHSLLPLVVRGGRLAAVLAALLVALSGLRAAEAQQRAASSRSAATAPAARTTPSGATVRTWKANGTTFRHENQRMHGKTVHWERATTGKSGTTRVRGKTWGSTYKGHEWQKDGKSLRKVTVEGSDGTRRGVFSVTDRKGTTRTTITGLPDGTTRRITSWRVGNTQMTDTRDYGADGKVVKRQRTGSRAR